MHKVNNIDHPLSKSITPKGKFFIIIVCVLIIIGISISLIADENDSDYPFLGRWVAVEYQDTLSSDMNLSNIKFYLTFNKDNYSSKVVTS
ncbi:MAG: hypothetical protein LBS60_06105 [Deltaproteobacteria bacterium]|jgi:hypothetical protein|nr:hypothetical protein [Deltaproteobacteria bacterium]